MAQQTVNAFGTVIGGADVYDTNAGQEQQLTLNNRGDLRVAQSLPPLSELVRLGKVWACVIPSGSAFTHVAALPTTRAELVLLNNGSDSDPCLVILSTFHLGITSMAAAGSFSLIAQTINNHAAVTDDATALITSRSGQLTYSGKAQRDVGITTAVANKWELLATSIAGGSATAQIGLGTYADMQGGWIIRPGDALAVNAVASVAAGTGIIGVTWAEVLLTLG